ARTAAGGSPVPGRWTPSAPTARATSTRSLTRRRARWRAVSSRRSVASRRRSPAGRSFSRSWTARSPAPTHASTTARRGRPAWAWRSVTRVRPFTPYFPAASRPHLLGVGGRAPVGHPFQGARGRGVELARDATGLVGQPAGLDRQLHGLGHRLRVTGLR